MKPFSEVFDLQRLEALKADLRVKNYLDVILFALWLLKWSIKQRKAGKVLMVGDPIQQHAHEVSPPQLGRVRPTHTN